MANPAEELVDVIDAEGRTVGIVTRREMRTKRLPHRCVYVLVFNTQGELLMHQRTPTKDIFPSRWDVAVGGVLAAGEDYATGARREAEEELGIVAPLELLFPFRYEDERTVVQAMVYRICHDGPFRLQPEEVACAEFVTMEELESHRRERQFCPDGLEVLAEYRLRFGGKF
jgi:isopentenyldiphosphate isomerase